MNNAELMAYANKRLAENPPVVATVGDTNYVLDTEDAECEHSSVSYSNDSHTWVACDDCGEEWTAEEFYGSSNEDTDAHWKRLGEDY